MATRTGSTDERRGLTRWQAIPLAVGSIAGSGILFLPSAVFVETGGGSLLVWVVAVALCIPMLLMFEDMVRSKPEGDGIEAFVREGLGDVVGRCVPVLFVALVIVGLPAGSVVAGRYLAQAVGSDAALVGGAVAVLAVAVAVNAFGARASNRLQSVGTWALIAMALALLASALSSAAYGIETVAVPDSTILTTALPTVVLAFWAFAGFENLTFLSREFRRPARDFLPVSVIALSVYGVLTVLLTIAIAVRVPRGEVDPIAGLIQIARDIRPVGLAVAVVTAIAFGAMILNAVSWTWGVSRAVSDAAGRGILPRALHSPDTALPGRALVLLSALFSVVLTVLTLVPTIVVDALATASAIFILMYLLCIVSYLRVRGLTVRSGLNAVLLVVMAASLVQSGWRSVYGLVVLALALGVQAYVQARRRNRSTDAAVTVSDQDDEQ